MNGDTKHPILDRLAALVSVRPGLVVGVLLAATVGLGSQIPKLEVDPAPENLISSFEGNEIEITNDFKEYFGNTDRVVVLLVSAPDVLTQEPLQYVHDLTRHFEHDESIERAESITVLNLPRRAAEGSTTENLENLENLDDLGDLDDEESLDDLADEEENDEDWEDEVGDEVMDAVLDLIEEDESRFVGGLAALGPELAKMSTDPIAATDEVTAAGVTELRRIVDDQPLVLGRLVSRDHTVAVVAMYVNPMNARDMRAWVESVNAHLSANPPPAGAEIHIGGLPHLRSQIVANMRADQLMLIPLTLLVCVLFLFLSFRWLPGVLLPIAAVGLTAVMVVGGMAVAHEPINALNNIIPVLLIIIGISDSIHLIGRYWEETQRGKSKPQANESAVRSMAVACLLTSVTTAVGLASLVVSRTVMLRHFGVVAAIGVLVAYIVTILFLPSVLSWASAPAGRAEKARHGAWLEVGLMRLTAWVLRRPWWIIGGTVVFLGVSVFGATLVEVDHALLDQFDENDPVYTTTRLLEDKLDGVRPLEVMLTAEETGRFEDPDVLAAIDEVEAWAVAQPEVLRAMGPSDLLHEAYYLIADDPEVRSERFRSTKQIRALSTLLGRRDPDPMSFFLADEGRRGRIQIKVRDVGAQATMELIDELRGRFETALGADSGIQVNFAGDAYTGSRGQDAVVSDLLKSLATAVIIIFGLLTLLFRSVRLGLLSIPPNLIPLVGTMGYMAIRGIPLNVATVIIFSISIGLAVDGTIHVLARFREETKRGLAPSPALVRAARGTGRAIVISSVTLMAGFAVLLMSSFVPVRHFGELIAVTIGGCLVATLIVQPALLKVAGTHSKKPANAA